MSDYLLDSSFVIDLLNELADGVDGPAVAWLAAHPRARLWISPVTLTEVLEGADDPAAVRRYLARFRWQGIQAALVGVTGLIAATINKSLVHLEREGIVAELTNRRRGRVFAYRRYVDELAAELPGVR